MVQIKLALADILLEYINIDVSIKIEWTDVLIFISDVRCNFTFKLKNILSLK